MMLAAITLLPAVIGVVGHNIDRWRVPSLIHHPDGAEARADRHESIWERWATTVARHAWLVRHRSACSILLVLAWPVLSMRLGESDDGNLPTSTTQRQAYDLIAQGFGPGTNGPLLVVVALPSTSDPDLAHRHLRRHHEDTRTSPRCSRRRLSPTRPVSRSR